MDKTDKSSSFHLQAESSSFSSRSKDVFGSLDIIEKKHDEKQKEIDGQPLLQRKQSELWKSDPEEEITAGERSQFKRPSTRPPSYRRAKHRRLGNTTPDYKVHPNKWTKYSLEDVETSDLSESSNSRAAFAFLEERRKLREAEEMKGDPQGEEAGGKIVFKKPSKVTSGVNTFSSKRPKGSKTDKVNIRLSDADEVVEGNEELPVVKRESHTDAVNTDSGDKSPTEEVAKVSFKRSSKKRSIRVRAEDLEEEEEGDLGSASGT